MVFDSYEKRLRQENEREAIIEELFEMLSKLLKDENKALKIVSDYDTSPKDSVSGTILVSVEDYKILREKYFPYNKVSEATKGVRGFVPWIVVYMDLIEMFYKEEFLKFDSPLSNVYDLKFESLKRETSDQYEIDNGYYYGEGVIRNMVVYKRLVCDDSKINYQKALIFLIQHGFIKYSDEKPWHEYVSYRDIFQFFEWVDKHSRRN